MSSKSLVNKLPKNSKGGVKDDEFKLDWSLLPFESLEPIVGILTQGAKKYSPDNWKKVERKRYEAAMLRHYIAFKKGETIDEEFGYSHLAHMACNALFLVSLYGTDKPD